MARTNRLLTFLAICVFVPGLTAGCAMVRPVPLTDEQLRLRAEQDLAEIFGSGETTEEPITLYEAMARALRFNLDHRLEVTRETVAMREFELARYDMLPRLIQEVGWNSRSNLPASSSISFASGTQSLEPSFSSPKSVFDADLRLSWNLLDFGLSYFRARQAGDRILQAEEQRRRVMQRIVHDVRVAFWRATSSDWALDQAGALEGRVATALHASQESRERRLAAPLATLSYERELIGIQRELRELQRDLSLSKVQLAALMNLNPGQEYSLAAAGPESEAIELTVSISEMQQAALRDRPELREVAYEERINTQEGRAALLELLPGIELGLGVQYNDNPFLVHQDWLNFGAKATQQLLRIISLPARLAKLEAKKEMIHAQRLALTMAVLTQIHVSRAQYEHARAEYETALSFEQTQRQILDQVRSAARAKRASKQSLIREEMNTLVASVKRDRAYAELEGAFAEVLVAMGADPLPEKLEVSSLPELTAALERSYAAR